MEKSFWDDRWNNQQIGFHEALPNPLLISHLKHLNLEAGDTIFIPLCGKSVDIDWLAAQGFRVTGIEFNRDAALSVFDRLKIKPEIQELGKLMLLHASNIRIFVGDFFDLSNDQLGNIHAIYDRGAIVALPFETRMKYAKHLLDLTNNAPQLLICYDYDQQSMQGPPFSVPQTEIGEHYADSYNIEKLECHEIRGALSERCTGTENLYLLT